MLKILLKKQFAEMFRNFFYDPRKNKMRPPLKIAAWFVLYFLIIVVMMGGLFTLMSMSICGFLLQADMGWLYFLLMGMIAILIGTFGSVFSTYTELYLSRDNELLLSMPIPVKTIIAARLLNVYLMGVMYAAVVILPAIIVYWVTAGVTISRVICGILLFLIVTVFILLLSCLLGWLVAQISRRLRNKTYITVLFSLLFLAAYFYVYSKANTIIETFMLNALNYGEKIRGAMHGLYFFGRVGEGDWFAAMLLSGITAVLFVLIWRTLTCSFMNIAAFGGYTEKVRYVKKTARVRTPYTALLFKEFSRFASSSNYIMNCGLGVFMIPVCGVMLLIKGPQVMEAFGQVMSFHPDTPAVILSLMLCMLTSMNDMVVPSVSLEGKNIWITQSLPVAPKTIFRAKMGMQLILTLIPMLFAAICATIITEGSVVLKLLAIIFPLVFSVFSAVCGMAIGVRMPLLNWTNEVAVIKQSWSVLIAIFGSWIIVGILIGGYFLFGYKITAAGYLLLCTAVSVLVTVFLLRWLDTRGSQIYAAL